MPILAEIDQNRAKVALFCLEIKINCYSNSRFWQGYYFLSSYAQLKLRYALMVSCLLAKIALIYAGGKLLPLGISSD